MYSDYIAPKLYLFNDREQYIGKYVNELFMAYF